MVEEGWHEYFLLWLEIDQYFAQKFLMMEAEIDGMSVKTNFFEVCFGPVIFSDVKIIEKVLSRRTAS